MSAFDQRKQQILHDLAVPAESYTDASPKGSVDEGIAELVNEINRLDGLVTTSSCAGRVAVYQEGKTSTINNDQTSTSVGKGGGRWLYVSHDPVPLGSISTTGALSTLLSLPIDQHATSPVTGEDISFIHLKFEPMILHILCSSLLIARKILGAALAAGFRESGISSINDSQDLVMVAIRSAGLAFDSIVAYHDHEMDQPTMMVSEQYLQTLVEVANKRFELNSIRKERFRTAALNALQYEINGSNEKPDWEPADVRRERKRAEGMQRKQLKLQADLVAKQARDVTVEEEDDLGIGFEQD